MSTFLNEINIEDFQDTYFRIIQNPRRQKKEQVQTALSGKQNISNPHHTDSILPPNQKGRVRIPIPIGIPMKLSILEYMCCIGTPAVQCMTLKILSAWESLVEIPIRVDWKVAPSLREIYGHIRKTESVFQRRNGKRWLNCAFRHCTPMKY